MTNPRKLPKLVRLTTVPISMNIIMRGQLRFMSRYFEVIGVTGRDEKHFAACGTREGIRMHDITMSRTISPVRDLFSLWKLYRFFRNERPAIVHTHTPKAGLLGMLAGWLARVPVRMHTVGGMPLVEARGLKRKILNLAETITYACAHRVYPNSKGLKEVILQNRFCADNKLKVLANGGSNGIDLGYFSAASFSLQGERESLRRDLSIPADALVFCFVGRIAREKGIAELVDCFQSLRDAFPEQKLKLLLIGPFESTHGVLDEATKGRIQSDPDILTPGRFDDVRPYYFLSDVYVFPSYREGFPNTLLEAGAMGLPAIASDINGCNEIVRDSVNGLIVPPKDTAALRDAMRLMIEDGELRRRLAENARPVIAAGFGQEIVWNAMLTEYRALLETSPSRKYAVSEI